MLMKDLPCDSKGYYITMHVDNVIKSSIFFRLVCVQPTLSREKNRKMGSMCLLQAANGFYSIIQHIT